MIIDSLENLSLYEQINPYFKEAFDFLRKTNFTELSAGKTILKEDSIIVNINDSKLKPETDAKLEVHNKYIDIQIPISSSETFGWKSRSKCTEPIDSFDTEKDILFYQDTPTTYFTLQPEEFVIFFPEDAHAPCVGQGDIRKIIIKVSVK